MKKTKLFLSILISFILFTVSAISDIQFVPAVNIKAATAIPGILVKSKTLYAGGDSYSIKLKNRAVNAIVTYKTSNISVAGVSSKGVIKPLKEGNAKITVTVKQYLKNYIFSIKVTVKASKSNPTPTVTVSPTSAPAQSSSDNSNKSVFNTSFENGVSGFAKRGSETVTVTNSTAKSGSKCLEVSNRIQTWHGASKDMTGILKTDKTYQVTAWLKQTSSFSNLTVQCTIDKNNGSYAGIDSVELPYNTWTKLECILTMTEDIHSIKVYYECPASATAGFYIDDIDFTELADNANSSINSGNAANISNIPSLAKTYKNYFLIGAAVSDYTLYSGLTKNLVLSQFNIITMENALKPSYLLDHSTSVSDLSKYNLSPAIKTDKMEEYLKYAKNNGLKIMFHVLVWHQQTPRWFFVENYSEDPNASLVSRDMMLLRLENYIRQVMKVASKYPGVIYAWDVVNEAIEPNDHNADSIRSSNNLWYKVIGADYVEKAFEYARKYSYDKTPLFYNDYSTYVPERRTAIYNLLQKLKDKGLVDGIGMQTHIDMNSPSISDYEDTLRTFAKLNLQINVTEMDMHNTQNTDSALQMQAQRYGLFFQTLVKLKKEGTANITAVTFWGTLDSYSWLTSFKGETSYPLLFNKNAQPKPAFYSVINAINQ